VERNRDSLGPRLILREPRRSGRRGNDMCDSDAHRRGQPRGSNLFVAGARPRDADA